jgi:hypothetical protein
MMRMNKTDVFDSSFILLSSSFDSAHLRHIVMRARDDVYADDFADPAGGFCAGIDGGANGGDITLESDGDQAAADLVLFDKSDIRRFEGGIARFDSGHDALGLNQSDRFTIRHDNLLCGMGSLAHVLNFFSNSL